MTAWLGEQVLAYGSFGILAAVLLPALEAALPVIGALTPGQAAVGSAGCSPGTATSRSRQPCSPRSWARCSATSPAGPDDIPVEAPPVHRAGPGADRTARGSAVFVGRFTAVLRTLVPPLCGATGMPLRRYPFCSVVSSAVWASAFVLIGYVTGRRGPGDTSEGAGSCQCRQMPHATP